MSYRELRKFTETMRVLGYTRLISFENFRTPNFELVADILSWMTKKYDPNILIPEEIDREEDRIEFISKVTSIIYSKLYLKLNPIKLYAADGYAVKELLKLSQLLYKALSSVSEETEVSKTYDNLEEENYNIFEILLKSTPSGTQNYIKDPQLLRKLTTELIDSGIKLNNLLQNELAIKEERQNALNLLDLLFSSTASGSRESTNLYQLVENRLFQLITELKNEISDYERQINENELDEKKLIQNIKKKEAEIERDTKRLETLQQVKPTFLVTYEKLEKELMVYYERYCNAYRNLQYLQNQMEIRQEIEKEKINEKQKNLKRMQKKMREQELRILRGEEEKDDGETMESDVNENTTTRGRVSGEENRSLKGKSSSKQGAKKHGRDEDNEDDEEEEEEEENDEARRKINIKLISKEKLEQKNSAKQPINSATSKKSSEDDDDDENSLGSSDDDDGEIEIGNTATKTHSNEKLNFSQKADAVDQKKKIGTASNGKYKSEEDDDGDDSENNMDSSTVRKKGQKLRDDSSEELSSSEDDGAEDEDENETEEEMKTNRKQNNDDEDNDVDEEEEDSNEDF